MASKGMPRAGGKRDEKVTPGPKPKNKECHVVDKEGTVNWDRTQSTFPLKRSGRG